MGPTVSRWEQVADDPFKASVDYAWVPRDLFATIQHSQGQDRAVGQVYTNQDIVIRGFDVDLTSDDHELEDFGVYRYDVNRAFVDFHDIGWDDTFNWGLDWAVLRNE